MDNVKEMHNQTESVKAANSSSHYNIIVLGICVGLIGVFLRFAGDGPLFSWASNILFVIGSVIGVKGVLNILK